MIRINSVPVCEEYKDVPGAIISMFSDLQYWSSDALKILQEGALEMAIELAQADHEGLEDPAKKAKCTRFISTTKGRLTRIRNNPRNERGMLLNQLYDEILATEGHARLRGFGFGNKFGDKLKGNAEYQPSK